jgi:nicotinate phosphoribosyltransferase
MGSALITDLYELNMAASYLRRGMVASATFSLFVRNLAPDRGFLVAAGLDDCIDYLEGLRVSAEDTAWMAGAGFPSDLVDALADLRFTGEVDAVAEGRAVGAGEPLLEVTAPLPEAQLVESYLLNRVTFQTAIATKAARCTLAADGITLVDFALRRAHGLDGAMAMARSSAMAGFAGTSNVEAARRLGLPAVGTMAHSYIQAFPTEEEAFRSFVADLPGPYTFLVDTYDTVEGTRAAARVIADLGLDGPLAVRLDSGDLVALSFEARRVLDEAGLHRVRIFVSGSLDEFRLEKLRASGAPIDAAGVGTKVGVSSDAPYVDSVYKLVVVDGRPVVKLSEGKETLPGAKQVWRREGQPDVLALRHEQGPPGAEALLEPVMAEGRRLAAPTTIDAARERLRRDLDALPAEARRIRDPVPRAIVHSAELGRLAATVSERHRPSDEAVGAATGSSGARPA